MAIKNILLDMDGPLLDGKQRHYQCYSDIVSALGFLPIDVDVYWEMKRMGKSRREQLAMSDAGSIYDTFLSEWIKKIEQLEYLEYDGVQSGAINKLKGWRNSGVSINLVTMRSNKNNLLVQLESTGLDVYLSSVTVCGHAKGGKGKAEAVKEAHPELMGTPSLWIGDTEADYEGARAFGCPVWLLSCGLRTNEFLKSLEPDFLSYSINDVKLEKIESCQ